MSVNKDRPHVLVLPEDSANRQLANGFHQQLERIRCLQVLPVAGGWIKVLDLFVTVHAKEMDRNPLRFMILLIDFDNQDGRLQDVKAKIPDHLTDRVFILGTLSEPEDLTTLGSYETIGSAMAQDCRDDTNKIWEHELLIHNSGELDRLRQHVRPILFP